MDIFEKKVKEADALRDVDSKQAIQKYREAIDLYRGKYLAENPYSEWSYTIRNRYHRLYIQTVLNLMGLLKSKKLYLDIVEIYEKAVITAPFEESIHIYYLEALIELKQFKNALSHYNYFTGKIYREFAVSPSPALQKIYRMITSEQEGRRVADVLFLGQDLSEYDNMEGALYCESDYFRTIYNLERRKSLRSGNTDFLGLISIIKNQPDISKFESEQAIDNLIDVLLNSLRKGDVFCKWNQYQMLVLLTDVIEANLQLIEKRIQKRFRDLEPPTKFKMKIDFQPVTAIDPFF